MVQEGHLAQLERYKSFSESEPALRLVYQHRDEFPEPAAEEELEEGEASEHEITASRARELGRTPIVTGDFVDVVGDVSGEPGTLARVVRVRDRSTILRRSADDTDAVERVIVANADQLVVVAALGDRLAALAVARQLARRDGAAAAEVAAAMRPVDLALRHAQLLHDRVADDTEPALAGNGRGTLQLVR